MDQWETAGRVGGAPAGDASGYPAPTWALGAPETRYAKSEDGYVAYQVFGGGPFDLLFIGNWASNIEVMWEQPVDGALPESSGSLRTGDLLRQARCWPI